MSERKEHTPGHRPGCGCLDCALARLAIRSAAQIKAIVDLHIAKKEPSPGG